MRELTERLSSMMQKDIIGVSYRNPGHLDGPPIWSQEFVVFELLKPTASSSRTGYSDPDQSRCRGSLELQSCQSIMG